MDTDIALGWAIKLAASWALIAIPYSLAKGHAEQQYPTSTHVRISLYVQHFAIACVLTGLVWLFYDLDGRIVEGLSDMKRNSFGVAVFILTTVSAIAGLNKGFSAGKSKPTLAQLNSAVATLRNRERKKLTDMAGIVTMALQREQDPAAKRELEKALEEAQQALEADRQ